MTVDELISELEQFEGEREVYVASSHTEAYRLLGVIGSGNRQVILDPSVSDDDKVEHLVLGKRSALGKIA